MKRYFVTLSVVAIASHFFCSQSIAAPAFDHLEPSYVGEYPKYREVLISKLGVTPFDFGRSIILPFGQPEASESVYSMSKNGQPVYYVTHISSERDLWDLTDGGRHPEMARSVKTQRIDAELPQKTAELLRRVWLGMLQGPQKPRPTPPPSPPKRGAAGNSEERFVLIDASFFEFSIERPNRPPLVGALNISAGYAGTKRTTLPRAPRGIRGFGDRLRMLVEISEAVYEYCVAESAQRSAIAKKIDHKATLLLQML